MNHRQTLTCLLILFLPSSGANADVIRLNPSKDNSIYSESAELSNGAGMFLFAGTNGGGKARRSLIDFDLEGSIPAGATITNATLELNMSRTISDEQIVNIHRVLRDWGEGTSDAPGQEGSGAGVTDGDATWSNAVFPDMLWATLGGDFNEEPSASTPIGDLGVYTWTSNALVSDIQFWLENPSSNFGWILIGPEDNNGTVKRFDSRQNPVNANRPMLTIEYAPSELDGDFDKSGSLDVSDIDLLTQVVLSGSNDPDFDLTDDGLVDQSDRTKWVVELKQTWFGDSDLNGEFGTEDLIMAFRAGEYEDDVAENSTWATGDWSGDSEFSTTDLIRAFQDGGYLKGPRFAVRTVPEPNGGFAGFIACLIVANWTLNLRSKRQHFSC